MNTVYAYSWRLASNDLASVHQVMEALRTFCVEHGCEEVTDLDVKTNSFKFRATVPNADHHVFNLTLSDEENCWTASSWLRVSSFKEISKIMFQAATHGIAVRTTFAGMVMCYRKNNLGVIEVDQRSAFDQDTF